LRVLILILLITSNYIFADHYALFKKENNVFVIKKLCDGAKFANPIDIKTLGIKGDGRDEHDLLEKIFNEGGSYIIKNMDLLTGAEIYINNPIKLQLQFINSSLSVTDGKESIRSLIYVDQNVDFFEISGAKLNGKNRVNNGLYIKTSNYIYNNEIFNIATKKNDNEFAVGIFMPVSVNTNICSNISKNYIHNIFGWDDGHITNFQGASRAIAILWKSVDRNITAYIDSNHIDYITGEEGDALYIYDGSKIKTNNHSYIYITNNKISRCNRRFIKGLASNMVITDNEFLSFSVNAPEAYNGASMIEASGNNSNIKIERNKLFGNGKFYYLLNTDSLVNASIKNNTFFNRGAKEGTAKGLTLRINNCKNLFFDSNIIDSNSEYQFKIEGTASKNVVIKNNTIKINSGNKMISHFYGSRKENITFIKNKIIGNGNNAILNSFLWVDNGTDMKNIDISENVIGNKDHPLILNNFIRVFGQNHNFSNVSIENNVIQAIETKFFYGYALGLNHKKNKIINLDIDF